MGKVFKNFLNKLHVVSVLTSFHFVILALAYSLLVGCITTSTVKRDYCNGVDAYREGRLDALAGRTTENFAEKTRMCAEYEVMLNQSEYKKGRMAGLRAFCTYEKGYDFGLQGRGYRNICPRNRSEPFLKGYREGDKKCLYKEGYSHALDGAPSSAFSSVKCLKLSEEQSQKEYMKGWRAGLKAFCTYQKGYEFGRDAKKYQNICPKKRSASFLKGYRQGDKKCLYDTGYSHALDGAPSSTFSYVKCLKLSKTKSQKEYMKGWKAGVKVFCTYKEGYKLGLDNTEYQNICPKKLEADFFKGYTLGLQEYREKKRQEELLAIEREKIAVERERIREQQRARQEMQALERERIAVERAKVKEQEKATEEILLLQKLGGRQLCKFDSDCGKNGDCRYNFQLRKNVCYYD